MRAHTHTLTHPYIYTYCTFNSHNTLQTTIESKKKKKSYYRYLYKPSVHQTESKIRKRNKRTEKPTKCWNELDADHDTCSLQV